MCKIQIAQDAAIYQKKHDYNLILSRIDRLFSINQRFFLRPSDAFAREYFVKLISLFL